MKRRLPWIVCLAVAAVAVVAIVVLLRQSNRMREGKNELAYDVELYCGSLESDLQFAADKLKERVPALQRPGLSAEDKQRAEWAFDTALPLGAGNIALGENARPGRGAASLAFTQWFGFCAGLRDVSDQRRNEVNRTFSEHNQRFREAEDREVIALAVAKMAEAAAEVSSWPLRAHRRSVVSK